MVIGSVNFKSAPNIFIKQNSEVIKCDCKKKMPRHLRHFLLLLKLTYIL